MVPPKRKKKRRDEDLIKSQKEAVGLLLTAIGIGRALETPAQQPFPSETEKDAPTTQGAAPTGSEAEELQRGMDDIREDLDELIEEQAALREEFAASYRRILEQCPQSEENLGDLLERAVTFMMGAAFTAFYEPLVQRYGEAGFHLLKDRFFAPAPAPSPSDATEVHFQPEEAHKILRKLDRWKHRSLKALSNGESPSVPCPSKKIPKGMRQDVHRRLDAIQPRVDVEAVFDALIDQYGLDVLRESGAEGS